jgi:hypothetical protein
MINLKGLGHDTDFKFLDKKQAIMGQCTTKDSAQMRAQQSTCTTRIIQSRGGSREQSRVCSQAQQCTQQRTEQTHLAVVVGQQTEKTQRTEQKTTGHMGNRVPISVSHRWSNLQSHGSHRSRIQTLVVTSVGDPILIRSIRMFWGLQDPDPDPLVRGMDPDPVASLF